jgi:hypothetical protein
MILTTKSGNPYKSESSALGAAANPLQHGLKCDYKVIEQDGGWVIDADMPEPATEIVVEETEEQSRQEKVSEEIDEKTFEFSGDFEPSNLLSIPEQFKDNRYRYRWCNTTAEGNILKKQAEGWVIDTEISKKRDMTYITKSIIEQDFKNNTQKGLGRETRLRELILMKIPVERAEARSKYYRDKSSNLVTQTKNRLNNETQGAAFGSMEVTN